VPSFTFTATATALELCGYEPYIMDVDATTWLLDPERILAHRELDRAGLIVPVAPFGRPVPQAVWRDVAIRTGVPIVIDGAAAFDALSAGETDFLGEIPVILSFHATKSFSSGEGGGVITTNADLSTRIDQALNFGFLDNRETRSASINGKMSEYHAAVGLAEFADWAGKLSAFRAVAANYRLEAERVGILQQIVATPDVSSCYLLFNSNSPQQSSSVVKSLARDGVDFRFWYGGGLHSQPYFSTANRDECLDVTERVAACLIGLPMAQDLDERTIARVVAAVRSGLQVPN
jgi:dTDP-4-amino-4,6-dideoxygalactose transaminase